MRNLTARFGLAMVIGMAVHPMTAWADAITIDGQRLDNVLISKTSAFYYVQIPREGRTINIPIENVDDSLVQINDDPFYREKLREEYKKNKELRDAGQEFEVDPAFRAGNARLGSSSSSADLLGGGGDGGGGSPAGGMGVRRTDVEQTLSGFGASFQPGPGRGGQPSVVANLGGAKLELVGPPDQLNGMVLSASGPPQQIEMMIGQQRLMVSQMSPGATQAMNEALNEAKQSGYSKKTAGNLTLEITYTKQGETVAYEYKAMAGG